MTRWLIPLQRFSSLALWFSFVPIPLFAGLAALVAAAFVDRRSWIPVAGLGCCMTSMALGGALVLFPFFAWTRRGGSREFFDEVARGLGTTAKYPSMWWPTVCPHLEAKVDGREVRIQLLRQGGLIGAYRPGGGGIFVWQLFVTVSGSSPQVFAVFPAGTTLLMAPGLWSGKPVKVGDPAFAGLHVLASDDPVGAAKLAAESEFLAAAAKAASFPGFGVAMLQRDEAKWSGQLRAPVTPTQVVALVHDLADWIRRTDHGSA